MATKTQSLAHTKWLCKYRIVFTPKYRRKVIYNQYRNSLREILRRLCEYKGVKIIEGDLMADHVHMLVLIPPKIAVSSFMGYLKSYMNSNFWSMSAEHYGSTGVQNLFKKMTPGYVRSGTRAIINSGSRAIGGYASGAALLVAAKIDNEMTFKGHPDLIAKANMLDETAYGIGVVTSLGATGATAGTLGTGAPLSYTASVGVNIFYGLFVEYQKYKLLKEKEERDKHVGI